ncbi:putative bifunctional diguanylate cyclase/phosphodiesterase [Paractinoplanes lichenicola]|uniref:Bifunctional diguanylate cyclase/phosphodiesterase n=1 Tax=Paractinoplanes lichenicola TaxID=2802976 RepID=A0ABS1VSU5_9ACTN|nr:bifunctional diguanylate cyclase/phosphodiesterase [Actinoplanes lichenicola]MBL7257533.1 bifunctional diguanylate cyclase/phosphodiesterase [Actinoplanes lichenicola]
MRHGRLWIWWLAAGVAAIAGHYVLPASSSTANLVYDVIGVMTVVAILLGLRLHRPARPAMWRWFAAGQVTFVLGDVTWEIYENVLHLSPYPSLADAFYLGSYPMFVVGLLLLVRQRRSSLGDLIDSAIVATGLALVFWIFVLYPVAADSGQTLVEHVVTIAYPVADVLLLALLARLFTSGGARTPSVHLLVLGTTLQLAGDTAFSVIPLYSDASTHPTDPIFLLSYVVWGVAALHPSMAAPPATGRVSARVGRGRLLLFGLCSLLAPALLLIPRVGGDPAGRLSVAVGATALILLVIARMSGFVFEVRRQSAELTRAAMSDALTGLASRRRFELALTDALAAGRPQMALLGLNGFKNVNDELGRPVGDRVLELLAERVAALAPESSVVARLGGDEFAVLLPSASADEIRVVAATLSSALGAPVAVGGHELYVGVAIGLAGGRGLTPVEVLRQAEAAMHAAKQTGEPVRRWTPALDERAGEFVRLGAEIRAALDHDQFRVVYQPIVELPSGRVAAVEALVRWEHPVRGVVSPAAFIPVAERNGLIVELGEWILRTACRQLAEWRATLGDRAPERVSVNVSARQLARPQFAATVAAALADSGLPASRLAVEVTETAVFEGGQAVTALHELRALGVRIALDDFGTGHSSLGLLQTVPVDILKVDKSFVDNVTQAGRHTVIAEALFQVSTGLGLSAVAEGVETAEQADALHRLGYRYLQGYYYGRPVAEPDFALSAAIAAGSEPVRA